MSELQRIADLMEQTFEGHAYYGPSVIGSLGTIGADTAARRSPYSTHSVWDIVAHLTAELDFHCRVIDGTAGPWVEGETTWQEISDTSDEAWEAAIAGLKQANRALVSALRQLGDEILDKKPIRIHGTYYHMAHGAMQHSIYHSGQITLLVKYWSAKDAAELK